MLHADDKAIAYHARQKGLRRSRKFYALGAAVAVLATMTGAYAWVTISGTGQATAEAAEIKGLEHVAVNIAPMLPGEDSDVVVTVDNPNGFKVRLTSVQRIGAFAVPAGKDCQLGQLTGPLRAAAPYELKPEAAAAASLEVPAKATAFQVTVPKALGLSEDATKTCAVGFDIKVTAVQLGKQP